MRSLPLDAAGRDRYRATRMFKDLERAAAVAWLVVAPACARPQPGVLTLAPAGMHASAGCIANRDGTLDMPDAATADSVVYADAGPVTIAITAAAVAGTPVSLALWFAGDKVGTTQAQPGAPQRFPFHLQVGSTGPTALRVAASGDASGQAAALLHVEKIVITEP
jgi:hypothetical protein